MLAIFRYLAIVLIFSQVSLFAKSYEIDGDFKGCDYDKLYLIKGGGVLQCNEYQYFYEYSPTVETLGRKVVSIGGKKVKATLHNGYSIKTRVKGSFEGCDFDKVISFLNGLLFVCQSYYYSYSYMPEVQIIVIEGYLPQVYINNKLYQGRLVEIK